MSLFEWVLGLGSAIMGAGIVLWGINNRVQTKVERTYQMYYNRLKDQFDLAVRETGSDGLRVGGGKLEFDAFNTFVVNIKAKRQPGRGGVTSSIIDLFLEDITVHPNLKHRLEVYKTASRHILSHFGGSLEVGFGPGREQRRFWNLANTLFQKGLQYATLSRFELLYLLIIFIGFLIQAAALVAFCP